ncbi:MAG: polysaccharide biosynthesis C-terminal domain-containing protein [Pseudomonadota bacterium]|nr:polysaccharide biosynthesis C-terminal domain-containing protein [Pseudomonadota bacterium]
MLPTLIKALRTFAARGLTGVALVALTWFVARRFGLEHAGFVNVVWSILLLVAMCARYGSDYAAVRNLAVAADANDHAGASAYLDASFGVLLVLLAIGVPVTLLLGGQLFAGYAVTSHEFALLGISIVVFGVLAFVAPLHRGLSRPDASYLFDQGGIAILLVLILATFPGSADFPARFLTALFAASLLLACISWWMFSRTYRQRFGVLPEPKPRPRFDALRAGLPYFLITISEYVLFWNGLLLLGLFAAPESVGVYAVLLRTAQLAVVAMSIINAIISPGLATLQAQDRRWRLRSHLRQVWKLNFVLGLLSLAALGALTPLALRAAGLAPDAGIYGAFLLLLLPQVLKIVLGPVGQIAAMSRASQPAQGRIAIGACVFSLVAGAVLVPRFGISGAAISYCGGLTLYLLLCLYLVRREHGFFAFEAGAKFLQDCFRR